MTRTKSLNDETSKTKKRNEKVTYVSEIINVQSLLNIRKLSSRDRQTNRSFDDRIVINVCGDRYETHRTTLELYPQTLLGNHQRRKHFFDKTRGEFFFDRNRSSFEAILYFYQSRGRLRRPSYVPIDIFLEEVNFFELGEDALKQLRTDENIKEVRKVRLPKNRFRRHLWATMEYPAYSLVAKIVNIFSLLLILLSTISLAVESLPTYIKTVDLGCQKVFSHLNETSHDRYICHLYFSSPFFLIQAFCTGFFTIELFLRIISTPSLIDFIKNFMNWIDVLAVIPFYIVLVIRLTGPENEINLAGYVGLRILRVLRFLRIFKLYQILKGIKTLRVLASTLKQSIPDFFIMIFILTLMSFLFGAAIFLAEYDANGEVFDSIFKATYWGVITITSVGYGDISPITTFGRIIACLCALFGAATIAVLVSVLVDRYQRVYARKLYIPEEIIDFHDYSDDESNEFSSKASIGPQRTKSNKTRDPVQLIIDYLNNERTSISKNLLRQLNSMIVEHNSEMNLRTNDGQVQFQISSSEGEEEEEELTEIVYGCEKKGNVLKTFSNPNFQDENENVQSHL